MRLNGLSPILHTEKTYPYLLNHTLLSIKNPEKFRARVKEIYFELLELTPDPNISTITELIDEENIFILSQFYEAFETSKEKIEDVIALYNHETSCMLDVWVAEVLSTLSLSFTGDPFQIIEKSKYQTHMDPAQNILLYKFL